MLFWILGSLLAVALWKMAWRFGPGWIGGPAGPAMFHLQARVLVKAEAGNPKLVEATLPAPEKGTSAEAQLRLMELWDGRSWTSKGAQLGRVEGRALRIAAGRLEVAQVVAVSAEKDEAGRKLCTVEVRMRWEGSDSHRELQRVAAIVGLRQNAPPGFSAPGQEVSRSIAFERDGWGWRPVVARRGPADPLWSNLARLF